MEWRYSVERRLLCLSRWVKCRVFHRHSWGFEIRKIGREVQFVTGRCLICGRKPGEVAVIGNRKRKDGGEQ